MGLKNASHLVNKNRINWSHVLIDEVVDVEELKQFEYLFKIISSL